MNQASKIRVGYGLDETVQMRPHGGKQKKGRSVRYIEKEIEEGTDLRLDYRKLRLFGEWPVAFFVNPTVFEDATPDIAFGREAIFGLVATVMRARPC